MRSNGETWCKNTNENLNNCPKISNYPNYALMLVWSLSKKRTILLYPCFRRSAGDATFMQRIHDASKREEDSCERMDSQEHESRPSLGDERLPSWRPIHYWISSQVSVARQYRFLGLESWMALMSTWQKRCWLGKKRTQLRWNPLLKQDQDKSQQ